MFGRIATRFICAQCYHKSDSDKATICVGYN